jgi:hypothetical protein
MLSGEFNRPLEEPATMSSPAHRGCAACWSGAAPGSSNARARLTITGSRGAYRTSSPAAG